MEGYLCSPCLGFGKTGASLGSKMLIKRCMRPMGLPFLAGSFALCIHPEKKTFLFLAGVYLYILEFITHIRHNTPLLVFFLLFPIPSFKFFYPFATSFLNFSPSANPPPHTHTTTTILFCIRYTPVSSAITFI